MSNRKGSPARNAADTWRKCATEKSRITAVTSAIRFSLESLSEGHADALERALWTALRKLNEQHAIQTNLAIAADSDAKLKARFNENAAAARADMDKLHDIISRL